MDERLMDNSKLSLLNDDLYFIRAFYEHAIEKWSTGNFDGAKQLFFILSEIIDDKLLSSSMRVHLLAVSQNIDMNTFYEKQVSVEQMSEDEKYGYFIVNFNFDTKEYLGKNKELLGNLIDELGHLLA